MTDSGGAANLFLREPGHQVSPRAVLMWRASNGLRSVILFVLAVLARLYWVAPTWGNVLMAVAFAYLLFGIVVVPWWRFKVHRWEVTDDAVYTQRGWFNVERRVAPINRVQTVDSERGPFAQLFGLTTVRITTASARGHLRIEGLDSQSADRIVAQVTHTAALSEGDAT